MTTDTPQTSGTRRPAATVAQATNDPVLLAFDGLLDAARNLHHLLGRALEREFGISFEMFEVLLLLGQAASPLPVRHIAQARVLTSGRASELVDRMRAVGLVRPEVSPRDKRIHLVALTEHGAATAVCAARQHADNVQHYMLDALPHDQRDTLLTALTRLDQIGSGAATAPAAATRPPQSRVCDDGRRRRKSTVCHPGTPAPG